MKPPIPSYPDVEKSSPAIESSIDLLSYLGQAKRLKDIKDASYK
jgi:hypothetical protein